MTVYVKTINGTTISVKCDRKQKAATISDEVERRSSIPRGMTYLLHQGKMMNEKKTIEENNIGAETTIEMSLRLLGGMDESDKKDTSETEGEREKKRKLEETSEGKSTRTSEESVFLQKEIIDAIKKSKEKMEIYSRKTDEKMDKFLQTITDSVATQLHGMNSTIVKMREEDDRYKQINVRVMNMEKKTLDID